MKISAFVLLVCLLIVLAVYWGKRANTESAPPNSTSVTKTKSSLRLSSKKKIVRNSYVEDKWQLGDPTSESEQAFEEAQTADAKLAILEKLQASDPDSLAPVLRRALLNPDENLRVQAVMMTPSLYSSSEEATDILAAASCDESAEVRNYALEMTHEQSAETKLGVFATTLNSPLPEVRETTVIELGRIKSKPALELLFQGLGNQDPAFVAKVNDELSTLIDTRFQSLDQAIQWWKSNSEKFDDRLIRMAD